MRPARLLARARTRRPGPSRPSSTSTACRRAPTTGCPSCAARAAWPPTCPASAARGKRGDGDFTMAGYDAFVEAFLDLAGVDRVRLVVHDWGAVGLLWAQRHPERVERLVVMDAVPLRRRLPLAPVRARVAHARAGRGRDGRHDALRAAPVAAARAGRRRLAALRPGHPARDPAALPCEPRGRRWPPPARDWATSPARRSSCGASRDSYLPRASPHALPTPSAVTSRSLHLLSAGHWPWRDRPEVVDRIVAFLDA